MAKAKEEREAARAAERERTKVRGGVSPLTIPACLTYFLLRSHALHSTNIMYSILALQPSVGRDRSIGVVMLRPVLEFQERVPYLPAGDAAERYLWGAPL